MKLEVLRFSSQQDSTNGLLFQVIDGKRDFLCYTLEDERREEKVKHETRIPAGTYKIKLRKEGGFHARYTKKYPDIHRGMLHVTDVPGFEYILIHTGNTDEHTSGCLIVGSSQTSNLVAKDGFIGSSTATYKQIYPPIARAIEDGQEVVIEYIDYD